MYLINWKIVAIWGLLLLNGCSTTGTHAKVYRAFSLDEASRILRKDAGHSAPSEVAELGSITRPIACVIDDRGDLIIVGECDPTGLKLKLDDLVVALRATLKFHEIPLVSIDPPESGAASAAQSVRFRGGIADTQFGADLLREDILLKKIGLGKIDANASGVKSYFDLCADDWKRTGNESAVQSRLWFEIDRRDDKTTVATRKGIAVIQKLDLRVTTEVCAATTLAGDVHDEMGEKFAEDLTVSLNTVTAAYPELRRLDQLARLTGIATWLKGLREKNELTSESLAYWLDQYAVTAAITPATFDRLSSIATFGERKMSISGGIDLSPIISDVKDGSYSAFRELVIKTRPQPSAIVWSVPFGDALDPDTTPTPGEKEKPVAPRQLTGPGTTLIREFCSVNRAPDTRWVTVDRAPVSQWPSFKEAAQPPRQQSRTPSRVEEFKASPAVPHAMPPTPEPRAASSAIVAPRPSPAQTSPPPRPAPAPSPRPAPPPMRH